jgi:hypothetical protein
LLLTFARGSDLVVIVESPEVTAENLRYRNV